MNLKRIAACLAWALCLCSFATAAEAGAAPMPELDGLVTKMQEKLKGGQRSAAQFEAELAELAELRSRYAQSDPEKAVRVITLELSFVQQVLGDEARARELRNLLLEKFERQIAGTQLARALASQARMDEAKAAQQEVIGKPAPELTFDWANLPGLKTLSDLKGKVVVIDFWATWCGPCIATFPQLRQLTEHYRDADVVVLGVTSLQGAVSGIGPQRIDTRNDPAREYQLTAQFIAEKEMTWPAAFSTESVFNPKYGVVGIPHLAIIAPDGTVRHNGLHPGMPHPEKIALIDALLTEFGKPLPRSP